MKRLLLILAILIIPAQAAVAAICAYCVHDMPSGPTHGALHAPASTSDTAGDSAAPAEAAAGNPCASCAPGTASMPLPAFGIPGTDDPAGSPEHRSVLYDPSHLERIERVPLSFAASF